MTKYNWGKRARVNFCMIDSIKLVETAEEAIEAFRQLKLFFTK